MKKVFSIIGIVVGTIIIIMGVVLYDMKAGDSNISRAEFGADYYTYSYNAARTTAENVYALSIIVQYGISFLLIGIGATSICFFGCQLADATKKIDTVVTIDPKDNVSEELPDL